MDLTLEDLENLKFSELSKEKFSEEIGSLFRQDAKAYHEERLNLSDPGFQNTYLVSDCEDLFEVSMEKFPKNLKGYFARFWLRMNKKSQINDWNEQFYGKRELEGNVSGKAGGVPYVEIKNVPFVDVDFLPGPFIFEYDESNSKHGFTALGESRHEYHHFWQLAFESKNSRSLNLETKEIFAYAVSLDTDHGEEYWNQLESLPNDWADTLDRQNPDEILSYLENNAELLETQLWGAYGSSAKQFSKVLDVFEGFRKRYDSEINSVGNRERAIGNIFSDYQIEEFGYN